MARDVNWWLMSLAFLLGLLLTLALTIRKVTREVPVNRTVEVPKPHLDKVAGAVAATGTGAAAKLHGTAEKVKADLEEKVAHVEHKVEHVKADVEHRVEHVKADVEHKVARVEDKNAVAYEQAEQVLEREPYGAGSIRVTARQTAPAGYTIKGDKDTGRYFTLDSPEYDSIEAEVWFANDESAEKAGFVRWNATGVHRASLVSAEAAAVVSEGHHVAADTVVTEGEHVSSETVITEHHGVPADSTLVIIDDGIPETQTRIIDDGIPEAESRIRIIGAD